MRRAVLLAVLAALAAAAPAAAFLPPVPSGSSVGEAVPLKAYASVTPTVDLFGDSITARVAVVADTKWVLPSRLQVTADFRPFLPVRAPTMLRVGSGRFQQLTWTWTLRCVTSPCVPRQPPSDLYHVFRFHPAHVDYLDASGKRQYGITAAFPAVKTLSQVSPGITAFLARHNALNWSYSLAPVAAPAYRVSPSLLFWLALGVGSAFALGGAGLLARWAVALRPHAPAAVAAAPQTALEQALVLFLWARERGDETLERKALERVADELAPASHDLAEKARALAWSPETPPVEEVADLSEAARTRSDT
jgi:hypothetical protein